MAKREKKATEFKLGPKTRASYLHVLEKTSVEGGKPHYSGCFIFPKNDKKSVESVKNAIKAAYEAGESILKGNAKNVPPLSSLKNPLRDGDAEYPDREEYRGCYFINANNYNRRPGVFDKEFQPLDDPEEVYSGMYVKVFGNCYAFNHGVNKGIALSLEHIMKVADGERFGGSYVSPEDAFGDDDDEDEDFLS